MEQPAPSKNNSIQAAIKAMQAKRPLRVEEICRDYLELNPGCRYPVRRQRSGCRKKAGHKKYTNIFS